MLIVSIILMVISTIILVFVVRKHKKITDNPYVIGELVQINKVNDEVGTLYEAIYKYTINGKQRGFISDRRKHKKDAFDEQIKLYYKYGNDNVFEKPSNEILGLSLILLFISIASFVVYLNI